MKSFFLILSLSLLPGIAEAQTTLQPSKQPLNIALIKKLNSPLIGREVVTANTISQKGLTIPSLWWAKEQFGGKLLNNWLAYPKERRVDLIVNRQLWALLDYMGRYSFVHNFGNIAREYGYNTRVFIITQPQTPLATYTCDFSSAQNHCSIELESLGKNNFGRIKDNSAY